MSPEDRLARPETIPWLVHDLLDQEAEVSIGDVLERSGLTRQAIQYHLKKMVESGELEPIGAGRGRRYRRPLLFERTLETKGLQEDQVWKQVRASVPDLERLNRNADRIANYAFTEMLNNAIDHSESEIVRVTSGDRGERFAFLIADQGVGAFEHVRRRADLEDHVAAIQEISKGKMTTDPKHHTGQGIFFTSKAVDFYSLASNGWRWLVDNTRGDQTIGESEIRKGTVVGFEVDPNTERNLTATFDEYTDDETLAFDKSRTTVRLFEFDVPFVSRSEAKRLARNLERFREVVVDFRGVKEVGQGFADELFRVWVGDHPETNLVPVNMNRAVKLIVERALADADSKPQS
jgi:anti-sigma regulatory factor (Ser/Thr protein kinase)